MRLIITPENLSKVLEFIEIAEVPDDQCINIALDGNELTIYAPNDYHLFDRDNYSSIFDLSLFTKEAFDELGLNITDFDGKTMTYDQIAESGESFMDFTFEGLDNRTKLSAIRSILDSLAYVYLDYCTIKSKSVNGLILDSVLMLMADIDTLTPTTDVVKTT